MLEFKQFTLLIYLALFLNFFNQIKAKREFELIFDNCSCSSPNPSYLSLLNCAPTKSRRSFNVEMQFTKDIKKWLLNMKITIPSKPTDFVLMNLTNLDGCRLLANKHPITLLHYGRNNMNHYSNLPKRCPILKDKLYYVRGFRFNLDMLPTLRLKSESHVTYQFMVDGKNIIQGYVENRITWKNK